MSNERFRRVAHVARFVEWRHGIAEDLARRFVVKYIRESKVAYSAFAGLSLRERLLCDQREAFDRILDCAGQALGVNQFLPMNCCAPTFRTLLPSRTSDPVKATTGQATNSDPLRSSATSTIWQMIVQQQAVRRRAGRRPVGAHSRGAPLGLIGVRLLRGSRTGICRKVPSQIG